LPYSFRSDLFDRPFPFIPPVVLGPGPGAGVCPGQPGPVVAQEHAPWTLDLQPWVGGGRAFSVLPGGSLSGPGRLAVAPLPGGVVTRRDGSGRAECPLAGDPLVGSSRHRGGGGVDRRADPGPGLDQCLPLGRSLPDALFASTLVGVAGGWTCPASPLGFLSGGAEPVAGQHLLGCISGTGPGLSGMGPEPPLAAGVALAA